MNARDFVVSLEKFERKVGRRVDFVVRRISLDVLTGIVMKTPVDTGRARGNWQVGLAGFVDGTLDVFDPSGGQAVGRGAATISQYKTKDRGLFINNNLPYIQRLEDGWSQQAPSGMVGLTLAQYPFIVRQAAAATRSVP